MTRYQRMFDRLDREGAGAFVPFSVLGDPDAETSLAFVRQLAVSGADALELGLPFSDPVADGPVVQAAATRALDAGVTQEDCWAIVEKVRKEFPELPIGLLVYANLVMHQQVDRFYARARDAGVDSVLVADAPMMEAGPLVDSAQRHGVSPVFIAPPNASESSLARIASQSESYVYVVSRAGVTGADEALRVDAEALIGRLVALGSAPPLLGFGISTPVHVRSALAMGARGAISGSAVVGYIERQRDNPVEMLAAVGRFVEQMKAATLSGGSDA